MYWDKEWKRNGGCGGKVASDGKNLVFASLMRYAHVRPAYGHIPAVSRTWINKIHLHAVYNENRFETITTILYNYFAIVIKGMIGGET